MIVITIAITPSVKASRRAGFTAADPTWKAGRLANTACHTPALARRAVHRLMIVFLRPPAAKEQPMQDPGALDPPVWAVLDDYEARARREEQLFERLTPEELGRRRDELLLPVGRATGRLMNLLVKETRAKRILEVGSSY